jgi:hypothetical protein
VDIHFELWRGADDIRALLRANGWRFDKSGSTHLTASHPEVTDQTTARSRLLQIGLLTSSRLRIEFGPQDT